MSSTEPLIGEFTPAKFTQDSIRGRLRESLAEGIYQDVGSSFHVLREMVQNGVDSIKDYREKKPHFEGEVRIRISPTSIEVFDTGLGMSRDELRQVVSFGASSKNPHFHIGFRGIGFWANSTLAGKVVIISKKLGERYKRALMVDVEGWKNEEAQLSLLQLLNKYVFEDKPSAEDAKEHYTIVRLTELTQMGRHLVTHQGDAEKYLKRTLPLEFVDFRQKETIRKLLNANVGNYETFRVFLNGDELFKPGNENLQDVRYDDIKIITASKKGRKQEKRVGWYWAALNSERGEIKNQLARGIIFRVKGFAIGDEGLFRSLFKTDEPTPDSFYGEIYVLDEGVTPDSSRTNFEGNKAWFEFIGALNASNGLISRLKKERRDFSNKDLAREKIPELVEASKNFVARPTAAGREEAEKIKAELEKRLPHAPDPELKKDGQDAIKQLDKALLSKRATAASTKHNDPKVVSAVRRFYLAVIKVLEQNIEDKTLLNKLKASIGKLLKVL